jgi:hypothetical protein
VEQYTALLSNITAALVNVQKAQQCKLLWVKTTPVPTVRPPEHKYPDQNSELTEIYLRFWEPVRLILPRCRCLRVRAHHRCAD